MSIFLVITPADYFSAEATMSCADPSVWDTMRWRVALLQQDESAYTFGAPTTVIADLGTVPAETNNQGEPEWGELLERVEVAGYDANDAMFFTEPIPYGLWMNCSYLPPQTGRTFDELWDGRISENT